MLRVNHLTYKFASRIILDDISAEFPKDKITVIVGPNGCGKSTLLSFLSRDKVAQGKIFLQGSDVNSLSPKDYARKVAILPQQRDIMADFYVKDVVVMGRFPYKEKFRDYTAEDRYKAQMAMEQVGIDTMAERRISHLSGGEIQRVMIAKNLSQTAPIILMDEPTNHLDVKYKLALMKIMRAYKGTVVMVLHDLSLAMEYSDRVILMKQGKLIRQGKTKDVLEPSLLADVFDAPFVRYEHEGRIYLNY